MPRPISSDTPRKYSLNDTINAGNTAVNDICEAFGLSEAEQTDAFFEEMGAAIWDIVSRHTAGRIPPMPR